jgi:hypothetical protein
VRITHGHLALLSIFVVKFVMLFVDLARRALRPRGHRSISL